MRPRSLAEVAELTLQGASFDLCLKNFLDGFYASPAAGALVLEPSRIGGKFPETGFIQDAYLAAVAEAVATNAGLETPAWAFAENRRLKRPWFALDYPSLRALLLWESPAPFRSRNLSVSENALDRV